MKISFNKLNGSNVKKRSAILKAMKRVVDSGCYVLGPEVKSFESAFADYIGVRHAVGVGNGMEAIQISLMALGIGPGDEVITTPLSAVATVLAITAMGAMPVFVDIDEFYHIDADKIERNITTKTKAIIPVHLYGQMTDMGKIMAMAKERSIEVIEDCAQAHGAKQNNRKAGSVGRLGCFSFYPTKNLGGIGDGGMITTNDDILAKKCRMLRNYGQKNRYKHEMKGMNSRLDELQAAILSEKLKWLDDNNRKRQDIANIYMKELNGIEGLELPKIRSSSEHVFHLFVIATEKRDSLMEHLKSIGIDSLVHYPIPIHEQACMSDLSKQKLPIVEEKTKKILSLPIHPYLTNREVDYVCTEIKAFYGV